jgi:SAM domain (Sterile alpha motif)
LAFPRLPRTVRPMARVICAAAVPAPPLAPCATSLQIRVAAPWKRTLCAALGRCCNECVPSKECLARVWDESPRGPKSRRNRGESGRNRNAADCGVAWFARIGRVCGRFVENDIEIDVLSELTDRDVDQLGISLGHRRKILRSIRDLGGGAAPVTKSSGSNLVESAVEPTRSVNITVSWRRSASSLAFGSGGAAA